ncbi:MAG: universal stress protein [Thiotrichales bacterium]|nr:universal stress protein [Thiotrichales bacterium]
MPAEVRKLLFCSDLSENSNVALRYAALLAKLTGADMHVLHVVEELSTDAKVTIQGFLMDAAKRNEALNERVRNIRSEVLKQQDAFWSQQSPDDQKVRKQVRSIDVIESYPAEQILRTSVKLGCDLIVMGAHEKGLSHTFLGGVAKSVLRRSRVPTLIVPMP